MSAAVNILNGCQMFSGSLSSSASAFMAITIWRSPNRLASPFQRLIFVLSLSDMVQSISSAFGPISAISEPEKINLWNIGNQRTCDIHGFTLHFGAVMCGFYTLYLCIYFHYVTTLGESNEQFYKRRERKMHVIALVYSFATSLIYLCLGYYNSLPYGNMCFVADSPFGCHLDPDIECNRGDHSSDTLLALTFIPGMVMCVAMHYYLGSLYIFVRRNGERQRQRLKASLSSSIQREELRGSGQNSIALFNRSKVPNQSNDDIEFQTSRLQSRRRSSNQIPYVTRAERRSLALNRQVFRQASLYAGAYLLAYTSPAMMYFAWQRQGTIHPISIGIVVHTLHPLQGTLNIIVNTYPQVSTLRKRCPQISYIRGLWEVMKAGGEFPGAYHRSQRRRTLGWQLGDDIPIETNRRFR